MNLTRMQDQLKTSNAEISYYFKTRSRSSNQFTMRNLDQSPRHTKIKKHKKFKSIKGDTENINNES